MIATKKQILQKISKSKFLKQRNSFSFRVCKLMKEGEFDSPLYSQNLTDLLNDGPGKKVRTSNLKALMDPLMREDLVKSTMVGRRENKKKIWFPTWIDKKI